MSKSDGQESALHDQSKSGKETAEYHRKTIVVSKIQSGLATTLVVGARSGGCCHSTATEPSVDDASRTTSSTSRKCC